jgi:hypothetical protein
MKNRKIKNLKEELQDFSILDRYVKGENEKLKKQSQKLQKDNEKLAFQNKKLCKSIGKWYQKYRKLVVYNQLLKRRLNERRNKTRGNLNILIDVASIC